MLFQCEVAYLLKICTDSRNANVRNDWIKICKIIIYRSTDKLSANAKFIALNWPKTLLFFSILVKRKIPEFIAYLYDSQLQIFIRVSYPLNLAVENRQRDKGKMEFIADKLSV